MWYLAKAQQECNAAGLDKDVLLIAFGLFLLKRFISDWKGS